MTKGRKPIIVLEKKNILEIGNKLERRNSQKKYQFQEGLKLKNIGKTS